MISSVSMGGKIFTTRTPSWKEALPGSLRYSFKASLCTASASSSESREMTAATRRESLSTSTVMRDTLAPSSTAAQRYEERTREQARVTNTGLSHLESMQLEPVGFQQA
eukprot:7319821-Prymnesium_polylepis.1